MNDSEGFGLNGLNDPGRREPNRGEPHPRALESPLPIGVRRPSTLPPALGDSRRLRTAPPAPGHALANKAFSGARPSGLQRAVGALRAALPFVQRILPLLDGNIGTAMSNILPPYPQMASSPPPVNLEPIEDGLAELQTQHRDLRNRILEQHASLKRVEDQLETVREATDRNTQEQKELLDDLKSVRKKVNRFALLALALLAVSVLLNVILYLHIRHVLP